MPNYTQQDIETSEQVVRNFLERFLPEHDYESLLLYASLPLVLTPELLHYLRHRFTPTIPWVAEIDILLEETLCQERGYEQYIIKPPIRSYLLQHIKNRRDIYIEDAARLMLQYLHAFAQTQPYASLSDMQAQHWSALAFVSDAKATVAQELIIAMETAANQQIRGKSDQSELKRLVALAEQLSLELEEYPAILEHAQHIRNLLSGRETRQISATSSSTIHKLIHDYSEDIAHLASNFVGRHLAFEAIEQFIEDNNSGYFIIQGNPGTGKSALAAQIVKRYDYIHHFNILPYAITKTSQFLTNICAQIITRYDLSYNLLPPEATQDGSFLEKLLGEVSSKLNGNTCTIVIDGLNEVDTTSSSPGANILYLPRSLPKGIYIIATSRRMSFTLNVDSAIEIFELVQDAPWNIGDVQEYIAQQIHTPTIQQYLLQHKLSKEDFINTLILKSQGNFIYLYYLMNDIANGRYSGTNLEELPKGLALYYDSFWQQLKGKYRVDWFAHRLPVITTLSLVYEPITLKLLSKFSQVDENYVQDILLDLDQFLNKEKNERYDGEISYSWYHSSFFEFISSKDMIASERINLQETRKKLADIVASLYKETSTPSPSELIEKTKSNSDNELKSSLADATDIFNIKPKESGFHSGSYGSKELQEFIDTNNSIILYTTTEATTSELWVEWKPNLNTSGLYEIATFIPKSHSNTTRARYKIHGIKGQSQELIVTVNQESNSDTWVLLGHFEFDKNQANAGKVVINDVTGESGKEIAFGPIRFRHVVDFQNIKGRDFEDDDRILAFIRKMEDRKEENETEFLSSLGTYYLHQSNLELAQTYYKLALPLARFTNKPSQVAAILSNLGFIYSELNQVEEAIDYYEQALNAKRQINDEIGEAAVLANLGGVYDSLGNLNESLNVYSQALTLKQRIRDDSGAAAILTRIGDIWVKFANEDNAVNYLEQALSIYQVLGDNVAISAVSNRIKTILSSENYKPNLPLESPLVIEKDLISHRISWLFEKRIILIEYNGNFNRTDIQQLTEELEIFLNEGEQPIHVILDTSKMVKSETHTQLFSKRFTSRKKLGWMWIIAADLNSVTHFIAETVLKQIGLKVRIAGNVQEALNTLKTLDLSLQEVQIKDITERTLSGSSTNLQNNYDLSEAERAYIIEKALIENGWDTNPFSLAKESMVSLHMRADYVLLDARDQSILTLVEITGPNVEIDDKFIKKWLHQHTNLPNIRYVYFTNGIKVVQLDLYRKVEDTFQQFPPAQVVLERRDLDRFLQKIGKISSPLEKVALTGLGITTGVNEVFVIDLNLRNKFIDADSRNWEIVKPLIRGRDLNRWKVDEGDEYIIYAHKKLEMETYPAVYEYLLDHREQLESRRSQNAWWQVHRDSNLSVMDKDKIVLPRIGSKIHFAYDNEKRAVLDSAVYIDSQDFSLLAILNSKLIQFILHKQLPHIKQKHYRVDLNILRELPIVRTTAYLPRLAELGEMCVYGTSEILDDLENEINHIVYSAYELTHDEIQYISG